LRWKNDQAGAFFIVTCEVVKIVFLLEDVILGELLAAGEAPEEDRGVDLRGEFGAAGGVNAVGFAFAALLSIGQRRRAKRGDEESDDS
jgi:hypothetical protein